MQKLLKNTLNIRKVVKLAICKGHTKESGQKRFILSRNFKEP